MFEKGAETHNCTAKLQPYDLHSNVYRSPPGDQGTFSLLIYVLVSLETLKSVLMTFDTPVCGFITI